MSAAIQSLGDAVRSSKLDKWMVFALLIFLLIIYIWVVRTPEIHGLLMMSAGGFLGLLKGNTEK